MLALSARTGLTAGLADSEWRRQRLLILCYHGVSLTDQHEWNPGLYVSRERLARRCELLRENGCTVLPLADAVGRLAAGTLPPRSVVLTFDDGFADFELSALPVLQRFRFPATVYLTSQRCEHNYPIVHLLLSYVLWKARDQVLDAAGLPGLTGRLELSSAGVRAAAVRAVDAAFRASGTEPAAKDAVAREIASRLGFDYDALREAGVLRLMGPAVVSALAAGGVDFQLHTHRHGTPEDPVEFVEEIRLNRERVERWTGRPARHFCYPSGAYRPEYLALLEREGVVSATTCDPDIASRRSHPLLLPRFIDTMAVSDRMFEGWILGATVWLPRRTKTAAVAR